MSTISILLVAFLTYLVVFAIGLTLGRWYARLVRALAALRQDMRRTKDEQMTDKTRTDTSPGVVVPSRDPEPIDLAETTGGVMPISPARIAAEEDAARKREAR